MSKVQKRSQTLKPRSLLLVTAALLSFTNLTACSNTVKDQGKKIGTINAGINLPPVPEKCREKVPHATLEEGTQLVTLLAQERRQLDKSEGLRSICNDQWDTVVSEFNKGPRARDKGPLPDKISQ